jgi:membrane protease YdiL (CAAX protease family)
MESVVPGTPWDKALSSILAAEKGDLSPGQSLVLEGSLPPGPVGEAFRRCWAAAYLGEERIPSEADRASVDRALRSGYAARLLEARLLVRQGGDAHTIREEARRWALGRLLLLAAVGATVLLGLGAGVVFAVILCVTWRRPMPEGLPHPDLSGRALLIVFLGWFLAFLSSGTLVAGILSPLPFLRPFALPMVYGLHACVGLALLHGLGDGTGGGFMKRLFPGSPWTCFRWATGFLALALTAMLAMALALSPFLHNREPPQKDLMDLLTGTHDPWMISVLFLLATVAAPLFEETLFRGTLLPWLGHRLGKGLGQKRGWILALCISALAFGAIHLEPAALPGLTVLGLVLGLAFLRTSNLLTSIMVHGLWNGGVFLVYRILMG